MKTRIDIISGYYCAGKTELISRMLRANQSANERIAVCTSEVDKAETVADMLVQLISKSRPGRILLETTGTMLLEDLPSLFRDSSIAELAYNGTPAFVMDGSAFQQKHALLQDYYSSQIRSASVVFINHIDKLSSGEKLAVLSRIWEINRHVHLMVAPLHGIDLWRVFDLPSADHMNSEQTIPINN